MIANPVSPPLLVSRRGISQALRNRNETPLAQARDAVFSTQLGPASDKNASQFIPATTNIMIQED